LAERGAAVVLEEERFSSRVLLQALETVFSNLKEHQKAAGEARKLTNPAAAVQIASEITSLIR